MLALGYGGTINTIYFKQAKKMVVPRWTMKYIFKIILTKDSNFQQGLNPLK
jgi:hypothetical protein